MVFRCSELVVVKGSILQTASSTARHDEMAVGHTGIQTVFIGCMRARMEGSKWKH